MTSTATVGSTGLVGSHILSTLLTLPTISSIHALSRRDPKLSTPSPKLHPLTSPDTSTWSTQLSSLTPPPSIFFSSLGTTRGQAGSFAAQRTIDYDLNLTLARAALDSQVPIYVLISTGGANSSSMFPYMKMKGELEDAVKALPFKHVVILRPGLIVGDREDFRPPEWVFRKLATVSGWVSNALKDGWAQDAEVIGRAAVAAGLKALEDVEGGKGKIPQVWVVEQADIVRMGRTEWKEGEGKA
ncbi:Protein fmp52, mitochondrial [Clarireedia jacksonii]